VKRRMGSSVDMDIESELEIARGEGGAYSGAEILVGEEYQATIPECRPLGAKEKQEYPDKDVLLWSPNSFQDTELDKYEVTAVTMYGYNKEQALGMLFWHKHLSDTPFSMSRAIEDLANFTPASSRWSENDQILFEEALQIKGKQFREIQKLMPEKTIKAIVQHYYSRERTAVAAMIKKKQDIVRVMDESGHLDMKTITEDDETCHGVLNTYIQLPTLARRADSPRHGHGS